MPYSVEWYIEKRVMLSRYEGIITLEDARGQKSEANVMMREGIPLVHFIVDLTNVTGNPVLQMVNELKSIDMAAMREKLGWTIVLTNNTLFKFASSLFVPIFKVRQRFFSSIDEALDFLQDIDSTLPPLKR